MGRKRRKVTGIRKLKWLFAIIVLLVCANAGFQIYRFPMQAMRLVPITGPKTLDQTWNSYGEDFISYQTANLPSEFLAALAHTESLGDAWAVPPWQMQWSADPLNWYKPMSSAFGLMQLTAPTAIQAIRLCEIGAAITPAHKNYCQKSIPTRLFPESSVALSSLLLDHQLRRLFRRYHKPKRKTQLQLAAIVHLCGEGGGKRFFRRGFNLSRMERCGSHRVSNYVNRVMRNYARLKN